MPTYTSVEVRHPIMRQCLARARKELLAGGFDPLSKKLGEAVRRRARRYYGEAFRA